MTSIKKREKKSLTYHQSQITLNSKTHGVRLTLLSERFTNFFCRLFRVFKKGKGVPNREL